MLRRDCSVPHWMQLAAVGAGLVLDRTRRQCARAGHARDLPPLARPPRRPSAVPRALRARVQGRAAGTATHSIRAMGGPGGAGAGCHQPCGVWLPPEPVHLHRRRSRLVFVDRTVDRAARDRCEAMRRRGRSRGAPNLQYQTPAVYDMGGGHIEFPVQPPRERGDGGRLQHRRAASLVPPLRALRRARPAAAVRPRVCAAAASVARARWPPPPWLKRCP